MKLHSGRNKKEAAIHAASFLFSNHLLLVFPFSFEHHVFEAFFFHVQQAGDVETNQKFSICIVVGVHEIVVLRHHPFVIAYKYLECM